MKKYSTIDEYINASDKSLRVVLEELHSTIQKAASDAKEKIAYGIPINQFANQLKSYQTSRGTVRSPLDQPLPLDLISKITQACVERNLSKS